MADGFGYGGLSGVPYPYRLYSPTQSPHQPDSAPPFLKRHPVESYVSTQAGFDPMISHDSYHRSPPYWSNNPSYSENFRYPSPTSSFLADNSRLGNRGPKGEDSYKDMSSPSGSYAPMEPPPDFVPLTTENFSERQHLNFVPTYNADTSAPVSSLGEMLIRNSQETSYKPIAPYGVNDSGNALDERSPRHYHPGYGKPERMNVVPGPPVKPYISVSVTDSIPSLPMSRLKTQSVLSQTGNQVRDGRSLQSKSDVCSHAPENIMGVQSSLHSSSIEPMNFGVLLGNGEATGHNKPFSENSDLRYQMVGSIGSRSPQSSHLRQFNINPSGSRFKDKLEGSGISSLYQGPNTLVADTENGVSERSLKNVNEDLNGHEPTHWSHFVALSEGASSPTMLTVDSEPYRAMKADDGNAQSAVNYKIPLEGSATQPSEDVQANQKPCTSEEDIFDIAYVDTSLQGLNWSRTLYADDISTTRSSERHFCDQGEITSSTSSPRDLGLKGSSRSNADYISTTRSSERHLCDQEDIPSPTSSPRVSTIVNAMYNLSEVLVYECFNNGSLLKLEQLEKLDKVVDNLTKCLKKINSNKTIAGAASIPTQAMHVSCPIVVSLNEAPKGVAKDVGIKEPVDKNEMTQDIKNILASNFPDTDSEENNPQTLLYKNLWLETEADLCSTTCMARFQRIKNDIDNLKLYKREKSADASTFMQEPFLNPQKSVPVMNNAEPEKTESLIKHGSNCVNDVATKSHDAPQSSRFNSDPMDAEILWLMSRSITSGLEQKNHGNFKPEVATSASITEDKHNDVIDRFQILKQQETNRKLMSSQNNQEASEMARFGKSSNVGDVMDRFQILKCREAEQMKKSLNSLDIGSNSDNDQATQIRQDSRMTRLQKFKICVDTEPSASGNGYESLTSDWEHVLKDN